MGCSPPMSTRPAYRTPRSRKLPGGPRRVCNRKERAGRSCRSSTGGEGVGGSAPRAPRLIPPGARTGTYGETLAGSSEGASRRRRATRPTKSPPRVMDRRGVVWCPGPGVEPGDNPRSEPRGRSPLSYRGMDAATGLAGRKDHLGFSSQELAGEPDGLVEKRLLLRRGLLRSWSGIGRGQREHRQDGEEERQREVVRCHAGAVVGGEGITGGASE